MGAGGCQTGIEHDVAAVGEQPAVGLPFFILRSVVYIARRAFAVWIDPRIAFESALVALLDCKSQGIPARILAARAGQHGVPGLVARLVHGVGQAADLEAHAGEIMCGKVVEKVGELLLGCSLAV